jgi:hypothetical protein
MFPRATSESNDERRGLDGVILWIADIYSLMVMLEPKNTVTTPRF